MRSLGVMLAGALALSSASAHAASPLPAAPDFTYRIGEGQNLNLFARSGPAAAHVLLRNGPEPRILVAFPAGNSGVGLWFNRLTTPAAWQWTAAPRMVTLPDARGRMMRGIEVGAIVSAPRLMVKHALLTSVRFLRDYQAIGRVPAEVVATATRTADTLDYRRDRLDGAPGYRLRIRVLNGGRVEGETLVAGADGRLALAITALTGDPPLTPLAPGELLNARAAPDPAARNALAFLSYREKFLAGSWRFNTYFGRDTLMSLRLLMPALQPRAIEAGLGSVLARVNEGQVAHEEGIGEFAVVSNKAHGRPATDAPELDYKMVDSDYMLAPVAANYLLHMADRDAARAFLARPLALEARPGEQASAGAMLVGNLLHVVETARAFAAAPGKANLIGIKTGFHAGQWRDSDDGIGGGRYPYDVNAVLVPAALEGTAQLFEAGLLDPYLGSHRPELARAAAIARVWRREAPPLFRVERSAAEARPAIAAYARAAGVPAGPALAALGGKPLVFHALSLNADGSPVPIVNSDEGFALLFGDPAPADLDIYVGAAMRPFPAGLMTDVGLLVANPALASADWQARFTPGAYHGTVVWSWQQALFAAGLERQLARRDLPAPTRARLGEAQATLWRAIEATRAFQSSELWSWAYKGGRYAVVPFGAAAKDVDESNAAQLWSTVYLAVQPPR